MTKASPDWDAYFRALGHFAHIYSEVEAHVQILLWVVAGTKPTTARALFSGTRTDAAIDTIRRLFQARGLRSPPDLEETFAQIGAINKVRNHIFHYGAQFKDDALQVSNALIAIAGKLQTTQVSPEFLDDLRADCGTINNRLIAYITGGHGESRVAVMLGLDDAFLTPWRYKRPGQPDGRKQDRPKRQKRPHPP